MTPDRPAEGMDNGVRSHRRDERTPAYPSIAPKPGRARPEEAWTVGRLLTWTTDYLKRHGLGEPAPRCRGHAGPRARVAAGAALHALRRRGRARARAAGFATWSAAASEGAPVAYLVGRKEFYSLAFDGLAGRADPPPESEFVVVEFLELTTSPRVAPRRRRGHRLGLPGDRLGAPPPAARSSWRSTSAKRPWRSPGGTPPQHGVADRIDFRLGDRLEPVAGEGPFDAIISNPPYIPSEAIDHLEPGVRDYEPRPGPGRRTRRPRHGRPADRRVGRALEAGRPPDPGNRHRPGGARPRR